MTKHSCHKRVPRGQVLTALLLFIGLFVVGAIGLLIYEITRFELAKDQLRTCVDAASLAAASTLALSTDPADIARAQSSSVNAALDIFRKNSVLGIPLTTATVSPTSVLSPGASQGLLFVQFTDNANNLVPLGDVKGRAIKITGAFGVVPVFGRFLSIGKVVCQITADAGVPMLDIVNCFDVGGCMDDDTNVTLVKRVWIPDATDPTKGTLQISKVPRNGGPGFAEGPINGLTCSTASGVDVNGTNPQRLDNTTVAGLCHYQFNGQMRATPGPPNYAQGSTTFGLMGADDVGAPPGNYTATAPDYGYTDLVVNIDGRPVFSGFTFNGFQFPDLETLVEAARGNLETTATEGTAKSGTQTGVTPRAGYQEAYMMAATQASKPFAAVKSAVLDFNDQLRKESDAHIGLVTFNEEVGSHTFDTRITENVATSYAGGGKGEHDLPFWTPQVIDDATFNLIKTRTDLQHCYGNSNYALALNKAIDSYMVASIRPNAAKAIVMVTCAAPDVSQHAAMKAAAMRARDVGIPIYVVAVATRPDLISAQAAIFNDNTDAASGLAPGVCGISGHGSRFFQVRSAAELKNCFGNVARNLVQLVH